MIGKVSAETLESLIVSRTGSTDASVIQGAAYGEDTAAIRIDDQILVVNADPISLATEHVGRLGIHVVCNDVAASGARPRWVTNTMLLPTDERNVIDRITQQLDAAATELGVTIVGGHAEITSELSRPLLSLTAMGMTDRYISSGGARPGDHILLTGGAGLEGTAILASDFSDELLGSGVSEDIISLARAYITDISVVDVAMAVREQATAMHDPTEGGVLAGLVEMAIASGRTFEVERTRIPVRAETRRCAAAMNVDPLCIFGSGGLLVTVAADDVDAAIGACAQHEVEAAPIGTVRDGKPGVDIDDRFETSAPRDELYGMWV